MATRLTKIGGSRGNSFFYLTPENFLFKLNRSAQDGNAFLRCKVNSCHARGSLDVENCTLTQRGQHNHEPNISEVKKYEFLTALRRRAREEETPIHQVFTEESTRFQDVTLPSYSRKQSTLFKIRNRNRPPLPNSVDECFRIANGDARCQDVFSTSSVSCPSGFKSIIFLTTGERRRSLEHASSIYIDATFRVTPPLFYQLMSIHVTFMDEIFPAAYVLMERKTQDVYTSVFRQLSVLLPAFDPQVSMTDYETGLLGALTQAFPNIRQNGCWFHYCQALWRKTQDLGLTRHYRREEIVKKVVKMLMALPLLPANKIEEGINVTEELIQTVPARRRAPMQRLSQYIRDFWISQITPARLSVHGRNRRTNNSVESFYSNIRRWVGVAHPNFYTFLEKLRLIDREQHGKLLSVENGDWRRRPLSHARRRSERIIREKTEQLGSGRISIGEFLRAVRHATPELYIRDFVQEEQIHVDEEIDLPEQQIDLPEQQFDLPEQQIDLPEQQFDLPEQQFDLPEQQIDLPEEQFDLPELQIDLPEEQFDLPEQQFDLPEQQIDFPEEQFDLPEQQIDLPEEQFDLSEEQFDLPEQQIDLPEEQFDLPEQQFDLPEQQIDLPEEQFDLPEQQIDLPEEQIDLPEQQILTGRQIRRRRRNHVLHRRRKERRFLRLQMRRENANSNETVNNETPFALVCKVCLINPIEYMSEPCRHYIYCERCSNIVLNNPCALCRTHITAIVRIFMA